MKSFKIALPFFLLNLLISSTQAASSERSNVPTAENKKLYLSLNIGQAFPAAKFKNHEHYGKVKIKPASLQSLAVGYNVSKSLDIEFAIARYNRLGFSKVITESERIAKEIPGRELWIQNKWNFRQKISSTLFSTNLNYKVTEYEGFTPFVVAGLGMARNSSLSFSGKLVEPFPNRIKGNKKNVTSLAWHLGAGLNYKASDSVSLDLFTYKYHDLGKVSTGLLEAISPWGNYYKPAIKTHLKVHAITTGTRIHF